MVADELAGAEKACGAARVLAARRGAECGAHRARGFSDPVAWVARQGGTTHADARQALRTAADLEGFAATKQAVLAGEVSIAQAQVITRAEAELPGQEAALLAIARHADLSRLKDEVRERHVARSDPEALHRRQWAARRFRHWRDQMGMVCFDGALPPETGIPLVARIERLAQQRRRRVARPEGRQKERFAAHGADALVSLVLSPGPPGPAAGSHGDHVGDDAGPNDTAPGPGTPGPGTPGPGGARTPRHAGRAEVVFVCDLFAHRRGHTHPGEVCHIVGGGPVPPKVVADFASDAFVKAVLHDGVAIHSVAHFGRHLPAVLRTALDLGPVPAFSGAQCVDCGRRYGLEYDHVEPVATRGPTSYANLVARCYPDHQAKTERDRLAGRLGRRAQRSRAGPNG